MNRHPCDGSSKIRVGELRTKQSPLDAKKKVEMSIINEEGQRRNPVSSEEQSVEGFENIARIIMANAEYDESTTIENDVQFEIPPAKV